MFVLLGLCWAMKVWVTGLTAEICRGGGGVGGELGLF